MKTLDYKQAEAANLSKAQIYSLAESFAELVGYKSGNNITKTIEKLGGKVIIEDTLLSNPRRSGSLFIERTGNFKIILPMHTSISGDRFTLAHELGHYAVHYLFNRKQEPLIILRRESDRIEWEANWFAAAFLMPTAEFTKKYKEFSGNISKVANTFGVSNKVANTQAKALGL